MPCRRRRHLAGGLLWQQAAADRQDLRGLRGAGGHHAAVL
nr:MAG TPA: hypothetical protein [Caudoviricetes sp.]